MVVDGKGKIFEDRRKESRRENEFDSKGGRREKEERRKETQKIKKPEEIEAEKEE